MKKSPLSLPPEQTVADLAHLAWCSLVALRIAQQDSKALSPLTVHVFLLNWLASAQKQRRFPRSVAPDIDGLLRLGRQKGPAADLRRRLEVLWQSCTDPLKQQSDLFRLTYAIEALKSQGWLNAVVTDDEWEPAALQAEYAEVPALLVKKSELTLNFSDAGQLLGTVEFLVTGETSVATEAFAQQNLAHRMESLASGCLIVLHAARL